MSLLWEKICELFTTLVRPSRRKTRVTFSPSTLHREIIRHTKLTASQNPFFNFLAEIRMRANGADLSHPGQSMSSRETVRLSKTAGRMWNLMSEEQKQPYRNIALEQRKLKRLRGRKRRSLLTARRRKRRKSQSGQSASLITLSPPLAQWSTINMTNVDDGGAVCEAGIAKTIKN